MAGLSTGPGIGITLEPEVRTMIVDAVVVAGSVMVDDGTVDALTLLFDTLTQSATAANNFNFFMVVPKATLAANEEVGCVFRGETRGLAGTGGFALGQSLEVAINEYGLQNVVGSGKIVARAREAALVGETGSIYFNGECGFGGV